MNRKGFYFDEDPNPGGVTPDPKPVTPDPVTPDQKTIPYERFKEVNDKAKTLEDQLKAITDAQKQADEDKLKEENKWKDLYEKTEKEKTEKEKELLRLRVASRKGLPELLIDRLKGETEQELEADAEQLLASFSELNKSPGVPAKKPGGANTVLDIKSMSPEEIRKNAGALLRQANTN